MSEAVERPEPEDDSRGLDWLERNAQHFEPDNHTGSDSWKQAQENRNDADVQILGSDDLFRVEFPDADTGAHLCIFVTHTEGKHAAACSCEGWNYQGKCKHLLLLAMLDVRDDILRTHNDRAEALVEADGVEADVVEHVEDEDDQEDVEDDLEDDDQDGEVTVRDALDEVEGAEYEKADPYTTLEDADDQEDAPAGPSDPFAKELAEGIPDRYVMELGGEPYIRRAGFAALAREAGLSVQVKAIEPASKTDHEYARYEAVVSDGANVLGKDVGTAYLDTEDLQGARGELDELAATRAARRALEWATGAGHSLRD